MYCLEQVLLTSVSGTIMLVPTRSSSFSNMTPGGNSTTRHHQTNVWDKSKQSTFFDVRIFNSHAPVNCSSSTDACYRRHEHEKRRAYEQRVLDVEHGTFTPLVLSTSGGWGPSTTVAFKRLAGLIPEKYDQSYSSTLSFIRCKIAFSLIDSAIACLRVPRSAFHAPVRDLNLMDYPLDLIRAEVQLEA